MKLYAVVLIVVAILALSAICEAGNNRENLNSIATNISNTRRIETLAAALRAAETDQMGLQVALRDNPQKTSKKKDNENGKEIKLFGAIIGHKDDDTTNSNQQATNHQE
ncbi:hypothetical protein GPALN_005902 [Globodera pallida]|nr:hypothetical protein GPALN_005902 [Globodera pallida]